MKNQTPRYIFKIHSSRIIKAKYSINLTMDEARDNDELISLSESQVMRFIDGLNGIENINDKIDKLKYEIHRCNNKAIVKSKFKELYTLLFKDDYVNIIIDSNDDYYKLCENGFYINGIKFHRFLGTTNGVKKNTITFVNADKWEKIMEFTNCGRDMGKAFTPAKLEAYLALVCSSSVPVSNPYGVLVIKDCITEFIDNYIKLDDSDGGEPVRKNMEGPIELVENDGYGMAMPSLMEKWSEDIHEDYMIPGCVIRNAFCKGTVYPIDFQKFCHDNGVDEVTDIWGDVHNIDDIELVITESMLKLWDSYSSYKSYEDNFTKYGYTYSITKYSEKELENMRTTNYQFLQSYEFSDEDIDELISDTVNEIKDIMSQDSIKTILYMKGIGLNDNNVIKTMTGTIADALIFNSEVLNDPYIQSQIQHMINKRIDRAKIGVLNVPGNYALVCGDPYSLCQSMCGMEVTGLLKRHQIYSKYWSDRGIKRIAVFRAPMTCHNNIRILDVMATDEMKEFYKYITTATLFNSWDMCANALNGMDKDLISLCPYKTW